MDMSTHTARSSATGHQHEPQDGHQYEHAHDRQEPSAPGSADAALNDPVCGMTVSTESPHKAEHAGDDRGADD